MKKTIICIVLMFNLLVIAGEEKDSVKWLNISNAINSSIVSVLENSKDFSFKEQVIVVKIISFYKNKGEFSISNIINTRDYFSVNPSHYCFLDNHFVIFRTDSLKELFTKRTNYKLINDSVKKIIRATLAPNNFTGQAPSVYIFRYKRKKIIQLPFKPEYLIDEKYLYYNDKH